MSREKSFIKRVIIGAGNTSYEGWIATQEEDLLTLPEKKNYTEEEIFSSHKVDKLLNMKRNIFYIIR